MEDGKGTVSTQMSVPPLIKLSTAADRDEPVKSNELWGSLDEWCHLFAVLKMQNQIPGKSYSLFNGNNSFIFSPKYKYPRWNKVSSEPYP